MQEVFVCLSALHSELVLRPLQLGLRRPPRYANVSRRHEQVVPLLWQPDLRYNNVIRLGNQLSTR